MPSFSTSSHRQSRRGSSSTPISTRSSVGTGKPCPAPGRVRHWTARSSVERRRAVMALEVETLEESFDLVAPQGEELIKRFYERLFEAAPAVQPLFAKVDMEHQRQALL